LFVYVGRWRGLNGILSTQVVAISCLKEFKVCLLFSMLHTCSCVLSLTAVDAVDEHNAFNS